VHERVRLPIVTLDEAEAFHRVEELDRPAGLFARQLPLRAATGAATAAAAALDRHRLALNPEVGRRDPAAAIDKGKFERLSISEIRETRLLDRRNMDEHVVSAVITDDETESLLRIEEFDDAFAFANHLRGHAATAATAATAESSSAAATAESSAAAAEAAAVTVATAAAAAAESGAVAESAASAAVAAALLESEFAVLFFTETFALVAAASAAIPLAPSIETHASPNFRVPTIR